MIFFVAPKIIGGGTSRESIGNLGVERIQDAVKLEHIHVEQVGEGVMIQGDVVKPDGLTSPVYAQGRSVESRTV